MIDADKIALVTGANRGIGQEIARQLAARGFYLLLGARRPESAQATLSAIEASSGQAQIIPLDVSDQQSIERAFKMVQNLTDRIDVLINNAGMLQDEGQSILSIGSELLEQTLRTNAYGSLWMVQRFKPLLKAGSRVINISSGGGAICEGVSTWAPAYCISKTTLNAITLQLAEALAGQGILVNAVCPGWVRTDMGGASASRSVAEGADTPVWLATEAGTQINGQFLRDRKRIAW